MSHAVGLEEMICDTVDGYIEKAVTLAKSPHALCRLHAKLAENRLTKPLFDATRFAVHVETAFQTMFDRARNGLSPASFNVEAARE